MELTSVTLAGLRRSTLEFEAFRGRPFVILLGNRLTGPAVGMLTGLVHDRLPDEDLAVVQVFHLRGTPWRRRWLAEREIRRSTASQRLALFSARVARGLPVGDESRRIAVGLDWEGRITAPLGFGAASEFPIAAIVDEHLEVFAEVHEPDLETAVDRLVTTLASPARR
jgi:hypothetical protein